MKLAFVLYRYFPFGGLQRDMLDIAREALQRGHQITVYCTSWDGDILHGIDVQVIPARGWSNAARMSAFSRDLPAALAAKNFDLVVGFNKWPGLDWYYAADSCFAYKAWRERGFLYRSTTRARRYLGFEKAVFETDAKTQILELSLPERERFRTFYHTPVERFHTLPPGIPRDREAPENWRDIRVQTRNELGMRDHEKVMLAVGSGFRTKGLDRSIAVLRSLGRFDVRLLVIGQDNQQPFLKLASQYQVVDKVMFLGGRKDIPRLLQAGDVLLHPAYKENTGNVLLEAMVAGLPVVATDVCGYAHYINDASMGEVVNSPFSEAKFLAGIERVLVDNVETWHQKGAIFSAHSDLYSRAQIAVNVLEENFEENLKNGVAG